MSNKYFVIALLGVLLLSASCKDDEENTNTMYRKEMRKFVIELSNYARDAQQGFIVIPQNGQELITDNGEPDGSVQTEYVAAIDATGREDMFYGYYADDEATPYEDMQYLLDLCLLCERQGIEVMTTDYCSTHDNMDNSYDKNFQNGFVSFAADHRELDNIPQYPTPIFNENENDILDVSMVSNFLYLINSQNYNTKNDFIEAVRGTNYDLVIMDLFHNDEMFTSDEIEQLKIKHNGASRLVICYLSIGQAEDYRYYWRDSWTVGDPNWLLNEDPDWEGCFRVKYWDNDWKAIIFGNADSYLSHIMDAGFDGVYLDIIDGFEYFEEN